MAGPCQDRRAGAILPPQPGAKSRPRQKTALDLAPRQSFALRRRCALGVFVIFGVYGFNRLGLHRYAMGL